ncbi:MAG: 30S ribosomal protein S5 [Planctomycetota bacterium]|jgi:small subunit ribosomal protein S5
MAGSAGKGPDNKARAGAGGGAGGRGRGRGRGGPRRDNKREEKRFIETVVKISRNAKVVKGGRRFSFSAMVVVGDGKGRVGIGHGKANEVPTAVEKGVKEATKCMFKVPVVNGGTVTHETQGVFRGTKVSLFPAAPGTGLIAGAAVKAILVAAGYENVLTKTHGSTNPTNVLKATKVALDALRTLEQIEELRGIKLDGYHWPKKVKAKADKKAEAKPAPVAAAS